MRVVLDSNVLLAAFGTRGLCEAVTAACLESHEVIVSEHILEEVSRGLTEKFKVPPHQVKANIAFLREHCRTVKPAHVPSQACRDAKDLAVLGTALAAQAHCLVSGDQDLFVLRQFKEIPILSPRAFYDMLKKDGRGRS